MGEEYVNFRIADTFTDSLAKLTSDEQRAVKVTAFDLQSNPANSGMSFHKLDKARDKNFWSVRVSSDLRLIVHKTNASLMLCYVDHHDAAYRWAERRKLERHPKTGAAQLVKIRETVREIPIPKYVEATPAEPVKPPLFADVPGDDLLRYGVPAEWLEDVRQANEDSLLELADHLPDEAAEALLELATGSTPSVPEPVRSDDDPFAHPDAQRRFRVVRNVEELERALAYPWEKWAVFLHPAQRELVERTFNGPARVAGSAGTGKTIVALHRAVYLARSHPEARVLLATFSEALANALRRKVHRLISNEPRIGERLEVHAMNAIGRRLYELKVGPPQVASREVILPLLQEAAAEVGDHAFSERFLINEWEQVVDAWQLRSWEAYRDVLRLGRKTRLPERQREILWSIFERLRSKLEAQQVITYADMFSTLASRLTNAERVPFEFAVIDEAQDISVAQLRFLAALGGGRPNSLFFTGDLGQRIFQQAFSWKALGVDIRGRSRSLRVNYRTSHQIRTHADRLLGAELSDVDGNTETRRGTVSVFNGPPPQVEVCDSEADETEVVSAWLLARLEEGIRPHELGVFVRSEAELARAKGVLERVGVPFQLLDQHVELASEQIPLCTMHLAKGLEFRAVVVMACDDEVIPSQGRIEAVSDEADLAEVYSTERHLLYVACTRARDYLLVTGVDPVSEFVDDLGLG